MQYVKRRLSDEVLFSLKNSPVVFLNGPRQSGKSTLARMLIRNDYPAEYLSFDDESQLAAARLSPEIFLTSLKGPAVIDEVQMVPSLFRALKLAVDETRFRDKKRSNGMFLLTGSANIMVLPELSDSLVGRMIVKTLYPFAACEIFEGKGDFPERLFSLDFADTKAASSLDDVIRSATFPEISGKPQRECGEWLDSYRMTILERQASMIGEVEKIDLLPILLRILATRAGDLINDENVARDMKLKPAASKKYRGVLKAMFLTHDVLPWHRNIGKRLVRFPKGYLVDTLLLCHLLEWDLANMRERRPELYGHVVENFVASELRKLLSFSGIRAELRYFRTDSGEEVDFVLERPDGSLAGIEVKTSDNVNSDDFKGLETLRDITKDDFICGVVLYAGNKVVSFGEGLLAVPLSTLWQ